MSPLLAAAMEATALTLLAGYASGIGFGVFLLLARSGGGVK